MVQNVVLTIAFDALLARPPELSSASRPDVPESKLNQLHDRQSINRGTDRFGPPCSRRPQGSAISNTDLLRSDDAFFRVEHQRRGSGRPSVAPGCYRLNRTLRTKPVDPRTGKADDLFPQSESARLGEPFGIFRTLRRKRSLPQSRITRASANGAHWVHQTTFPSERRMVVRPPANPFESSGPRALVFYPFLP